MRAADEATMHWIPARLLMECAGREIASHLIRHHLQHKRDPLVVVLTGAGNNGGDGFVAARVLREAGYRIKVIALRNEEELKGEAQLNAMLYLQRGGELIRLPQAKAGSLDELKAELYSADVLLDGLLGTGFRIRAELTERTQPVRGAAAVWEQRALEQLIDWMNSASAERGTPLVAIDLPSGVDGSTGSIDGPAIWATETVALQALKCAHLLPPSAERCGQVYLAEIGILLDLPGLRRDERRVITKARTKEILMRGLVSNPQSHKGSRGHVLVLGGGAGHFGAAKIAGLAALNAGAGLATLALPRLTARVADNELLELMSVGLGEDSSGNFAAPNPAELSQLLKGKSALVVGPGMGVGPGALTLIEQLLPLLGELPLVLDADGLNLLAQKMTVENSQLGDLLPPAAVLTPHPGEMARLLGRDVRSIQADRFGSALELSRKLSCWTVLKGAYTVIASPDGRLEISPIATAVLGTGGSGDMLAGIIGAFLAQGMSPGDAAIAAVRVHGETGLAFDSPAGVTAGNLLSEVGSAIRKLLSVTNSASSERAFPGATLPIV